MGLDAIARCVNPWQIGFHVRVNGNASIQTDSNARLFRKIPVGFHASVEKYQFGGRDPEPAGGLDSIHPAVVPYQSENVRTRRYMDAEAPQLVFDDLRHVRIDA